jgi:CheY-like chemotaxis protein
MITTGITGFVGLTARVEVYMPSSGKSTGDNKPPVFGYYRCSQAYMRRRRLGVDVEIFNKLRKMNILLIDDDKFIRDSLAMFFKREGCNLLALETAEEGLEALQDHEYQIIIADYLLPGIDGLEFFRRIERFYPRTLRLLSTAYGNEIVVTEAERIGIKELIEKPYTAKTLEQLLSRLIEKEEQSLIPK